MTRDNIADILCIGAQRAMTSWLHTALTAHPGTHVFPNCDPVTSTCKEAHFWDWNRHRGIDWYRIIMRPLKDELKTLDFTPEYAFMSNANIDECKALNPTARVIYLLRDPLARAMSAIRMRTMWAHKNTPAEGLTIQLDDEFTERCRNARLDEHGAYAANLRRWRARYPDMLILSVEAVQADPMGALAQIIAHCGLEPPQGEGLSALQRLAPTPVWQTTKYPFSRDCVHFLQGLTWLAREDVATEGFTFTEGAAILEAAS